MMRLLQRLMGMLLLASFPGFCLAEEGGVALGDFTVSQVQSPVSVLTLLTALSFIPFMMIALTTFTRNIVVLSWCGKRWASSRHRRTSC